jgi:DNA-binding beta-propeller fold protein YncE
VTTAGGVYKVNLGTARIVGRFAISGNHLATGPIVTTRRGTTAYVLADNFLTPINLRTDHAQRPIVIGPPTGGAADASGFPSGLAVSPNGRTAVVTSASMRSVTTIDLVSRTVRASMLLGGTPGAVVISPDGSLAYVANPGSSSIDIVNLSRGVIEPPLRGVGPAHELALSPDGRVAYVSSANDLLVIDLETSTVTKAIPITGMRSGYVAGPVVVSADGSRVYVANIESASASAQVVVISAGSLRTIDHLGAFSGPTALSLLDGGRVLYVLNDAASAGALVDPLRGSTIRNSLIALDLGGGRQVIARIPIPASPRSLGIGVF